MEHEHPKALAMSRHKDRLSRMLPCAGHLLAPQSTNPIRDQQDFCTNKQCVLETLSAALCMPTESWLASIALMYMCYWLFGGALLQTLHHAAHALLRS